jgi:small subunit ribosomal protein S20
MPVTKTAKRALRGSLRKKKVNDQLRTKLEVAIRMAKKSKTKKQIQTAQSLADKAAKKNIIHKNKAARIKSSLAKLNQKSSK